MTIINNKNRDGKPSPLPLKIVFLVHSLAKVIGLPLQGDNLGVKVKELEQSRRAAFPKAEQNTLRWSVCREF